MSQKITSEDKIARPQVPLRGRIAAIFDDDIPQNLAAHVFNILLALLIIVNVGAVILESVEPLHLRYAWQFDLIENVSTTVFAIEYVLRVWTSVDLHGGQFKEPIRGRLRYMTGFFPVIDLIAVLPAFLGFFGAADLRVLRLLRLLRMLKLTRHSSVFRLLWDVFREEARAMIALVFVICLTLTISGALMYMLEGSEQPTLFSSIPAGMWWAIETITTVGYGDMVPVTLAGRILGGIISVVGIGTLALFSGLITVSYLNQLRLRRERLHRPKHPGEHHPSEHHPSEHYAGEHTSEGHAPVAIHAICPHCGGSFTVSDAAHTEAERPSSA